MRSETVRPDHVEKPRRREHYFRHFRTILHDPARRHRLLFGVGVGSLGIVTTLAYFSYRLEYIPWDVGTTLRLQGVRFAPFRYAMRAASQPGYSPWSLGTIVGSVFLVAWRLGWRDGLYLSLVTAFQGLANHTMKVAIGRPRPTENVVQVFLPHVGNSFPSGHVMLYTVLYGFLFFLAWTRLPRSVGRTFALLVASALILLVGPSRIFLGAHWLSDVVAGYLIGLIILLFAIELYVERVAPPPARSFEYDNLASTTS